MVESGPDLSGLRHRDPAGRGHVTRWLSMRRAGMWMTVEATSETSGDCCNWDLSSTRFLFADQIHSTGFLRSLVFLEKGGNRHHSTIPRGVVPLRAVTLSLTEPQTQRWRGRPALAIPKPGRARRSGRFLSGVQGPDALATSVGEPQVLVEMVDADLPAKGAVGYIVGPQEQKGPRL
jgi:hypothetical protein